MIDAGKLRHRVTIKDPPPGTGSRGQATGSWTANPARSAEVIPLKGRELEIARQVYHKTTHRIRIRKPTDYTVTTQQRIAFKGADHAIGDVADDPEAVDVYLVLLTSQIK
jgi:SPP1 family predicted phage head-tail adaptor